MSTIATWMEVHQLWMRSSLFRQVNRVMTVATVCSFFIFTPCDIREGAYEQLLIEIGKGSLSSIVSSITAGATTAVTTYSLPAETGHSPSTTAATEGVGSTPTTTTGAAQDAATQTSSSPATSSSASSNSGSNTLSTGALVGSIVGSITGAIGSIVGIYFAYKSYSIKKEEKKEKASSGSQPQAVEHWDVSVDRIVFLSIQIIALENGVLDPDDHIVGHFEHQR
jgi:hypothetical protein